MMKKKFDWRTEVYNQAIPLVACGLWFLIGYIIGKT